MSNSLKDLEFTPKGKKTYQRDLKKAEKLLRESDLLEQEFQEWSARNQEYLNNSDTPDRMKRKLEKELGKYQRRYSSLAFKLGLLSRKNQKEITKELKRHG